MRALENRVATALRWRFFLLSVAPAPLHSLPDATLKPACRVAVGRFFARRSSRRASAGKDNLMSPLSPELVAKRERLLALIRGYDSCAVAFSGGVDSTVVAKAAQLALGDRAIAVTGTSASLAAGELDEARTLARLIGIRHEVIETEEFAEPAYLANAPDRCYHCKTELYTQLEGVTVRFGVAVVLNGANLDDRGDYRPGMTAAAEHQVRSPLLECELSKDDVRQLAASWNMPIWDKPASPCLSSRIAYGEEVTPERVRMIDQAEQFLRSPWPARVTGPLSQGGPGAARGSGRGSTATGRGGNAHAAPCATQESRLQVRDSRPGRIPLGQPQPGAACRKPARPPLASRSREWQLGLCRLSGVRASHR